MSYPLRRIVLVDDHGLFRAGVRSELDRTVEIVGETGSAADAVPPIRELDPDVVLLETHSRGAAGSPMVQTMRGPALLTGTVFAWALFADLASKAWMVAHEDTVYVIFNHTSPSRYASRIAMSLVAVAVTYGLAQAARWRGYGQIWGTWVGAGLLVAGVTGNGVSRLLWTRGVPDFVSVGPDAWNLADFEIAIGLTGGLLALAAPVLAAYVRGRIHVARPKPSTRPPSP